jgi:hypothetical protein
MPFSTIFQLYLSGSRHVLDLMVVGFTTTYAISAYHHWCCEFEFQSGRGVQHYVMKFVRDLRQVCGFLRVLQFPPSIKWRPQYSWNIVESGVKHHQTNKIYLSVLSVEESGVPRENHLTATCHWQTLSHKVVLSQIRSDFRHWLHR